MSFPPVIESGALPGTLLGDKYRLVRLIGRGAFGSVFEAEHAHLGRRVAIKVLHGGWDFPRSQQRFAREARALARLEHENVVSLIDAGEDATAGQYLVLEFIRGSTLRSVLPSMNERSLGRTVDIVRQLARGLGHAHAAGIVHRDLKPENVMLTSHADGQLLVKVLDFGIARLFDPEQELITMTGAALGTAAYMAPEQARGDRDVDRRVDVYALGVIVYEALSGLRPFDGGSYNETLFQILNKQHTPLTTLRPDLAPALCEVVERALAKDRTQRFDEVEEFARALGEAERARARGSTSIEANATLDVVDHARAFDAGGAQLAASDPSAASVSATSMSASRSPELPRAGASWRTFQQPLPVTAAAGALVGTAIGFVISTGLQQTRTIAPLQPPALPSLEHPSRPTATFSNAAPVLADAIPSASAAASASTAVRITNRDAPASPPSARVPRGPSPAPSVAPASGRIDRGF